MPTQLQALRAFADTEQNPDLLRLETLLSRFNLFEAIGVIRQELRHSDLLASLIDPSQRHGLETVFLRELLRDVLLTAVGESAVTQTDLDCWNLNQVQVSREWHRIDILVLDEVNHFAVIIENKIDTVQGPDQLERYYKDFMSLYPDYKVIALYLTRDGHAPNDDRYFPVSYTQICQVIEKIVRRHRSTLETGILILLEHYAQMLGRHIVSDSDVAELSRSIYKQHKQALDLIFEHVASQERQIWEYAQSLIQQTEAVYLGVKTKRYMTFGLNEWKKSGLFTSPPHVYFQFQKLATGLSIHLTLSPGDPVYRARMFEVAQEAHFPGCQSSLTPDYCCLASIPVLCTADYEKPQDETEGIISEKWAEFLQDELPRIIGVFEKAHWLRETP